MNVNQLMVKLRSYQKLGYGKTEVHMLAHDNCLGETQGEVNYVNLFEKGGSSDHDAGRDEDLYESIPDEVIYVSN